MSSIRERIAGLRRSEVGGLAGDVAWVALWQGSLALADLGIIAAVSHMLSLAEYGRFALVIALVTLVGSFLDLRVGIAATTYLTAKLKDQPSAAAGGMQICFLVAYGSAAIGLPVAIAAAAIVGADLIGDDSVALVAVYGLTLLATAPMQPCSALLRVVDRFRLLAVYTAFMEAGRLALVIATLAVTDELFWGIVAIVAAQAISGLGLTVFSVKAFWEASGGTSLLTSALASVDRDERRQLRSTIVHTNVISYARLAQVQLPTLFLGAVSTTTNVAVYKVGMAAAAIIGKAVDPASAALLPRLSRLWAAKRFDELRSLIERVTLYTAPLIALGMVLLVLFRDPVLHAIGGATAASEADFVLLIGATSQALYAVAFWRGAVLFSAHRARTVARVSIVAMLVQLVAIAFLIPAFDANGAAVALLISQLVVAIGLTSSAIRTLKEPERWVAASAF